MMQSSLIGGSPKFGGFGARFARGRVTLAAIGVGVAVVLSGCMTGPQPMPYAAAPTLPYAACGTMASLRNNLTGEPYPSPQSDAELATLGVRCVGRGYPAVRARY
jgi:hypothetical protein